VVVVVTLEVVVVVVVEVVEVVVVVVVVAVLMRFHLARRVRGLSYCCFPGDYGMLQ